MGVSVAFGKSVSEAVVVESVKVVVLEVPVVVEVELREVVVEVLLVVVEFVAVVVVVETVVVLMLGGGSLRSPLLLELIRPGQSTLADPEFGVFRNYVRQEVGHEHTFGGEEDRS